MTNTELNALLTTVAARHLGIETLDEQKSDSLDFHDVAVWSLRNALAAAYQAGAASGSAQRKNLAPKGANE